MTLEDTEKLHNGETVTRADVYTVEDMLDLPSHWLVYPTYFPTFVDVDIFLHEPTETYWATNPWSAHKDWMRVEQRYDEVKEEFYYIFPQRKAVIRAKMGTMQPLARMMHQAHIVFHRVSKGSYTTTKDRTDPCRNKISKTDMVKKIKALPDAPKAFTLTRSIRT